MPSTFATARRTSLPIKASGLNTFNGRQDWAQGTDIASAASIALPEDGNLFEVTGTTQIDTITGGQAGTRIALSFVGICPLSISGNIVPRGGARSTEAGEMIIFEARDNGGIEWVETATSSQSGAIGPNEITTRDSGMAGGDRASIDGTIGLNAIDLQPARSAAAAATGNIALSGVPNFGDTFTLDDGVNPAVEFSFANLPKGNIALSGQPNDADTVVIDDGVNPAVTFEFDNNASVVESATLRQVVIGGSVEATIDNLIAAINTAPALDVDAFDGATTDDTDLVNSNFGSAGNNALSGTDTAGVQTLTGMSGGTGIGTSDAGVDTGADAAENVTNMIAAVNGYSPLDITASAGAGTSMDLVNDVVGSSGNIPITNEDFAGVQTVTGMSGGQTSAAIGAESITLGKNVSAESVYGVAVGPDSSIGSTNAGGIVVGKSAKSYGLGLSMAMGYGAVADPGNAGTRDGTIVVGGNARGGHRRQVVIGMNAVGGDDVSATTDAEMAVVVGYGAKGYAADGVSIGNLAQVVQAGSTGDTGGVAIGAFAYVSSFGGVAIGRTANTSGGISIGRSSSGFGISIGEGATTAASIEAICIGVASNSDGTQTVVVGRGCQISASNTVAIGPNNDDNATGTNSLMIGRLNDAYSPYSFHVGSGNDVGTTNTDNILVGRANVITGANALDMILIGFGCIGPTGTFSRSIAMGNAARVYGNDAIAFGSGATCFNGGGVTQKGIAIGLNATVGSTSADGGISLGSESQSVGISATAVGYWAEADGDYSVAMGPFAKTYGSGDRSVAIGGGISTALVDRTYCGGANAVVIGHRAGSQTGADGVVVIGYQAAASNAAAIDAVIIGRASSTSDLNTIVIGPGISVDTTGSTGGIDAACIAIGSQQTFTANTHTCVLIGHEIVVDDDGCVMIGNTLNKDPALSFQAQGTVAIGHDIDFGRNAVHIGWRASVDTSTSAGLGRCVVIGNGATAWGGAVTINAFGSSAGAFTATANGGNNGPQAWSNHNASICIGSQAYGYKSIALGTVVNRPESFKIGAMPMAGYAYRQGTAGSGRPNVFYGCGTVAVLTQGPIDMVSAYSDPCRRWWSFPVYSTFFVEDISLASYTFDTLTTHGYVSVTGLQRTATSTTTTATSAAGSSVNLAVVDETGFSSGDWVLAIEGTLGGVDEKVKGLAKVTGTAANQITIDLQAEAEFNDVVGTHIVLLSGTDGNVLASTQLTGLSAVNQRENIVGALTQGYDVIVVERETAATATAMELIPQVRGILQEMKGAWTYS